MFCLHLAWHVAFSKDSSALSRHLPAMQVRAVRVFSSADEEKEVARLLSQEHGGFDGEPRSPGPAWGCVCNVLPIRGNLERSMPSSAP